MKRLCNQILSFGMCFIMVFTVMFSTTPMPIAAKTVDEEQKPGILAEFFRTNAYRGGPMELYNFEDKSGEKIINALNGTDFRQYFDYFNESGDFGTARFTSKLKIDTTGEYNFYGFGDDGFRVWMDGELIIDFWKGEWEVWQQSNPITLTAGYHDLKIEYLQGWGGSMLQFYWESSDAGIVKEKIPASAYYQPTNRNDLGLTTQIYQSKENANNILDYKFEGELTKATIESLDGTDLTGILLDAIGRTDYATAIIHGYIVPEQTGDYQFSMSGDDAYRLWIKDELIIDSWKLGSTGEHTSKSIHLQEGKLYKVRINYAQAVNNANLNLSWKNGDGNVEIIPARCYRQGINNLPDDNTVVHGLLAEVYNGLYLDEKKGEKIIPELSKSYGWGNLLNEFNGSSEYGSIRFTGELKVEEEGDYTFYLIGDDGFRLWVNNDLVIDFWESKWDIQKESDKIHLNEGMNDIKIEYFQGYGGSYILWEWSKTSFEDRVIVPAKNLYPASTKHGFIGEVFTCNADGSNEVKTGEILTKDFSYSEEELDTLLYISNADNGNSMIRWSGKMIPTDTRDYKLSLGANGTYHVTLDNEDIITRQNALDYTETTSDTITLTKGKSYNLFIEVVQPSDKSNLDLSWEFDGKKEIIPTSVLYAPDSIWYEKTLGRNDLYQVLLEATRLNNATTVGEAEGQTTGKAKEVFETAISIATLAWRDLDESSENLNEMATKLSNAIATFKANIIMSNEGKELTQFNNALYQGQDPFITYHDGYYYFVSSSNNPGHNKIYVSKSKSLLDQGEKVMIYDSDGIESRLFAPEIFFIDGKWYIYYCADFGLSGYSWRHMACVLESATDDPQGEWIDRGVLYTGTNGINQQANDFTVFEYRDQLYACWGTMEAGIGGPAIARMESPIKISEDRSFLPPDGGEGPRAIVNGDNLFITVSHGNFKSSGYHLGMYTFDNTKDDILNPDNWSSDEDVFHGNKDVYGPARASFFKSSDGTQNWMAFHSKVYPTNNNAWRQVSIKEYTFNIDGSPDFGNPVSPYEFVDLPSGDPGIGLVYQAEAATIEGGATKDYISKGFQGSGYVKVPGMDGSKVAFTVNAQEAGDYFVRVRYANGVMAPISDTDSRGEWEANIPDITPKKGTLGLYVNGIKTTTTGFDKTQTDWQHWMYSCNRVTLNPGNNEIAFIKTTNVSGDIYIDYIAVQEAHEAPDQPTKRTQAELEDLIHEAQEKEQNLHSIDSWTLFASSLEAAKKENSSDLALSVRYLSLMTAMEELSTHALLTVENATIKDETTNSQYEIGKEVIVTAIPPLGMKFVSWDAKGIELSEEDRIKDIITFTMPRNQVILKPIFELSGPDVDKPSTPTNILVSNIDKTSATIRWDASTDNVSVVGYHISLDNDDQIQVVSGASIYLTELMEGTEYTASITALDAAGNESDPGFVTFATAKAGDTIDRDRPTTPTHIRITELTKTSATLKWNESIDNVGVIGYQVSLGNDNRTQVVSGASIQLDGLTKGTRYTVSINALDEAGNMSDAGIITFVTRKNSSSSHSNHSSNDNNTLNPTNTLTTIKEDSTTKTVTTTKVNYQDGGSKITEIEVVITNKASMETTVENTKTIEDKVGNLVGETKLFIKKDATGKVIETMAFSMVHNIDTGIIVNISITIDGDGKVSTTANITTNKVDTKLEKEEAALEVKVDELTIQKAMEQLNEIMKDKNVLKNNPINVTMNLPTKEAIELIQDSKIQKVVFSILLPANSTLSIHNLMLEEEVLSVARITKTTILVIVKDTNGKELYTLSFDGAELNSSKTKLTDFNLVLQVIPTKSLLKEKNSIVKIIQKDKNNSVPKSAVLSMKDKGKFPISLSVKIYALTDNYIKPGSKVYLYFYNEKTNKLEELPSNIYKVSKDGFLTLKVTKDGDYVLLPKKPSKSVTKALKKTTSKKAK